MGKAIPILRRRGAQFLQKSLGISQRRAASHATIPSSQLYCPFTPPGKNNTGWTCAQRQLTRSSAARRTFSATVAVAHGDWHPPKAGEELYVTFIDKDGVEVKIAVSKGDNLMDVAQANDVEMEGACGGSCACSTCHVIVEDEDMFDKMNEPDDNENDMLDLAFGLTETSRLGCQIIMDESLDGLRLKLPSMTRNLQASDFSKKSGTGS
ncbi:2Fe-2S ferredoxin-type domain-containing protein [Calycina marina]|uniref:2Fe-2S ferredoxin-type domain-containing protein n=1 Tax=Calycina marina TaxID=1763456 RepID=A0A9P7YWE6_9HELO|nr:2Fe-2S ferredoxin-type domain-containing protein [Calycina marina]